jgi:hypothetical protein
LVTARAPCLSCLLGSLELREAVPQIFERFVDAGVVDRQLGDFRDDLLVGHAS